MRISWLAAAEIATARQALTDDGKTWADHFGAATFVAPPIPPNVGLLDWDRVTEHVARAERVSEVIREVGLDVARTRFAGEHHAIEAATLAAAAFEADRLAFDAVGGELLVELGYEVGRGWAADERWARSLRADAAVRRAVGGVARRIGRFGERIARRP